MSGRGRGAYYKAKYGGGRSRGGGGARPPASFQDDDAMDVEATDLNQSGVSSWEQLKNKLRKIDHQRYGAYKSLGGQYTHTSPDGDSLTLAIDAVQSDPFAPPSKLRAIVPLRVAGFPDSLVQDKQSSIALCDYLTRVAAKAIRGLSTDGSAVSAAKQAGAQQPRKAVFSINEPGNEVLERTSCVINLSDATIELRFTAQFPATGRTILGQYAALILTEQLPAMVYASLLFRKQDQHNLHDHVNSVVDQGALRDQLEPSNLVAFIANGSILPRASGASSLPLTGPDVVPFQSPPELEVELNQPSAGPIRGMGIPTGVTLLTGGGFHGKSTVLEALERGIYNYIPGDGRESVVSDGTAVKIRAEDGRSVTGVDITPFIADLPGGKDTRCFSTDDASGSTSMAATIQEELAAGARTLLIDEDSSATNLLVRDSRMQALVPHEPITPLVARVRALAAARAVSTVIVVGGLGDWLAVADTVIGLDRYRPACHTAEARRVLAAHPAGTSLKPLEHYGPVADRRLGRLPAAVTAHKGARVKQKSFIALPFADAAAAPADRTAADEQPGIDLGALDQLAETGQTQAACLFLKRLAGTQQGLAQGRWLADIGDETRRELETGGLDVLSSSKRGDLVALRWLDLVAVLSRLRGLQVMPGE